MASEANDKGKKLSLFDDHFSPRSLAIHVLGFSFYTSEEKNIVGAVDFLQKGLNTLVVRYPFLAGSIGSSRIHRQRIIQRSRNGSAPR